MLNENEGNTEVVSESQEVLNESWCSEQYKDIVSTKGFKTPDDVIKSYVNLEKMVGDSLRIPSEDATAEARQEFYSKISADPNVVVKGSEDFYSKLGKPESPEKYNLSDIFEDEKQAETFESELAKIKETAFELNLTEEQAKIMATKNFNDLQEQQKLADERIEEGKARLKEIWGEDYENQLAAAKEVNKIYSQKYPDEMEALLNSDAADSPVLLNMMAQLGQSLKERGHAGLQKINFGLTPDAALAKIAEKKMDPGFMDAYKTYNHPSHREAVAEMHRLYKIAHGE